MTLPLLLVGVGAGIYSVLAVPTEQAKNPPPEKQNIRTNIQRLVVEDYQVVIQTNGLVQAHNEVAFSAQVAGQVTQINPSFEVGATFKKGDVLVEIDASDYETALAIAKAQVESAKSSLSSQFWSINGTKNCSRKKVYPKRKLIRRLQRENRPLRNSIPLKPR